MTHGRAPTRLRGCRGGSKLLLFLGLLLTILYCSACQGPSGDAQAPEVIEAYIPMPPPGAHMAAGYFRLKNRSVQTLRLHGVSSSALGSVAMHETRMDQGVSKMRALEGVEFPPGSELVFEPGGRHLMISGLPEVAAPDGIPITLAFVRTDGTSLQVEVKFKLLSGDETDGATDHSGHSH